MAKLATEHIFTGTTQLYSAGYDSSKTLLGQCMIQNTGATAADKWVGPAPILLGRPMEASTTIATLYPYSIAVENNKILTFYADGATAAATRRIVLYEHDTSAKTYTWKGFITLTYPSATAHTIRGLVVVRHTYTTGTVSCSGNTTVTGGGSAWNSALIAVGARIGFNTTDPGSVAQWYYISAIGGDTSITLSGNGPNVTDVNYVIEEYRIYTATTNATAANGGLFVAKGITYDDFTNGGTTISAATNADKAKAVYWLANAATVLNTAAGCLAVNTSTISNTTTTLYITNADAGTTLRVYKYNGRAALSSVSSGKSTEAFVLRTGQQTVTGTISQTGGGVWANASHGPGSGTDSLYIITTTRVYRIAETNIVDASTTYLSDNMTENPPGTSTTFTAINSNSQIAYWSQIDRFVIATSAGSRSYITQYRTDSGQYDYMIQARTLQLDQTTVNADSTPFPDTGQTTYNINANGGWLTFNRTGTTAAQNIIYVVPAGVDWEFAVGTTSANQNRVITPSLSTSGCTKFYRAIMLDKQYLGENALIMPCNPVKLYYRTSGISDNSGSWNLIDAPYDLSGVSSANSIQFMLEFRAFTGFLLTNRIYSLAVLYEDGGNDSHYQPSVAHSSITSKIFAWRFSTAFGGTVPTLYVRLYDAVSGSLLVTDDTATPDGTFEKSTDNGGAWGAYNTTDKANETTYIRYTPLSLADNIKVRAVISQS